jgi:reactive intermediate/imine deaminase
LPGAKVTIGVQNKRKSEVMTNKSIIQTDKAPQAIGPYSQAVKAGDTVYLSGQIPLVPETMEVIAGDFSAKTRQVFENLKAVCEAAGGELKDIVKLNIYMTDLSNFTTVNDIMATYFQDPYPARAALGVAALPKGVPIEIEGVMVLS